MLNPLDIPAGIGMAAKPANTHSLRHQISQFPFHIITACSALNILTFHVQPQALWPLSVQNSNLTKSLGAPLGSSTAEKHEISIFHEVSSRRVTHKHVVMFSVMVLEGTLVHSRCRRGGRLLSRGSHSINKYIFQETLRHLAGKGYLL